MRTLISREPWWANAPTAGQSDFDLNWGYLVIYQVDGRYEFEFDQTRPPDAEIVNRKGCRTSANTSSGLEGNVDQSKQVSLVETLGSEGADCHL